MPSATLTSATVKAIASRTASPELCLFHNGLATLDLFLAELDLRSLAAGSDAAACVEQLFRVRTLLNGRHYLAFYRVRCWARRTFRIEARAHRGATPCVSELPFDGGRLDEVVNSALATLASGGELPAGAHVRFVFSAAAS